MECPATSSSPVADASNDNSLLMNARHGTAYHVETLVRKFRQARKLQDDGEKSHYGEIVFRDPRDVALDKFVEPLTLDKNDLDAWLDRQFFDMNIHADTCKSHWHAGDRMDWDLAISKLFLPPLTVNAEHYPPQIVRVDSRRG